MEVQKIEQEQFIDRLKTQIFEDQLSELQGVNELSKVLSYKVNEKYNEGFTAISKRDDKIAM